MKKLFSIFCCLLLSASMVTQAQVLLAPKKQAHPLVLKSANAPTKAPTATNRHNAPQEEYDLSVPYEWSDFKGYWVLQNGSTLRCARFRWVYDPSGDAIDFEAIVTYRKSDCQTLPYNVSGNPVTFPANGTYTITRNQYTALNHGYMMGGGGISADGTNYYMTDIWGYTMNSGNMWIQDGANKKPFVEALFYGGPSSTSTAYSFYLTIGHLFGFNLQATNGSIDMVDNDDNAHYYSNDQHYGFNAGTSATLTANPNPGYEFDHWEYNGANLSTDNPIDWTVASGDDTYNGNTDGYIHLTAVFRAAASGVDVTLNSNGGSNNNQVVSATNGSAMPTTLKAGGAIVAPTKTGYTFDGYVENSDGTGKKYYNADLTSANNWDKTVATTIYAKWTPSTYTVTVAKNNNGYGTLTDESDNVRVINNVPYGATFTVDGNQITINGTTVTATPAAATARYTYSFNNWTNALATITGDMTVTANFTRVTNTFTVTFEVKSTSAGYGLLQKDNETPTDQIIFTNVPYGTAKPTSTSGNAFTFMNSTVTPIPTEAANGYTYAVGSWSSFPTGTITSNKTAKISFTRTAIEYTITYNNYDISTYPGTVTTSYTVETPTITLLIAPNVAKEGYTFDGWYDNEELTGTPVTSIAKGSTGNKEFWAKWEAKTYAITYNAGANGTGTIAAGEKTYNEDFTLSSSTFTREGYTQTGWSTEDGGSKAYDLGGTYTANTAVTLYPYWEINTYDITFKNADGTTLKKSDGTTDAVYSVAYGATPVYDGAKPTKAADSEYTYTFNGWDNEIVAVTGAATYTATYSTTKVQYTLTWDVNGGNELTGTYTNGTIDWGTAITKPADPTKSGYTFNGWDADNDGTADNVAATMPTNNVTYKALWTAASPNITLCENCDNDHYNTFKTNYNGETVNVTYNRQFAEGRWSTMCLPFSLNLAKMTANNMYGCVYEFKYATGNANVGSGVNLYFSNAKSIEAGKCYIVNANAALAEKTSFVFSGVTIDLSKDNGADLSSPATPEASIAAYNALPGYKSEGTIELVGTLRNGILMGTATGNKYMGLKENKIYYPNISQGSTIWAYRGIFRSSEILDKESMQKMRIIVDGEDRGELIIDADGDILAPSDAQSRKFIENGVLYIEREGVIYDAQGKRIK